MITLRNWTIEDAPALYAMSRDEAFIQSGLPSYESIREAEDSILWWQKDREIGASVSKAIVETVSGKVAGMICLGDMNRYPGYYELEYAVSPEFRQKGYASAAVREMLKVAFETMQAQVVAAWVRSHNTGSMRVLGKCGFVLEGRLRHHGRDKSDTCCYSVIREDYFEILL